MGGGEEAADQHKASVQLTRPVLAHCYTVIQLTYPHQVKLLISESQSRDVTSTQFHFSFLNLTNQSEIMIDHLCCVDEKLWSAAVT